MTDKTDIAALREECAQWVKDTFGESIDTRMALNGDGTDYMQYDMAVIWRAWHHLSRKLEAERQQREALVESANALGESLSQSIQRAEAAEKEVTYWCNLNARKNEEAEELRERLVVIPTIWKHYGCGKVAHIYEQAMDAAGVKWRSVDDAIEEAGYPAKGE